MATTPLSELIPYETGDRRIDVLLVDDDAQTAEMTATYLERELENIETTVLTDPTAAVETLRNGGYDCVVSDFDMPPMDGLELLDRVRSAEIEVPFVLFTGKGSEEIASRAISAGVDEYLQKGGPEQYPVLANKVENLVEKHWAERQVRRGFLAIESAEEGIGIIDDDGVFQYMNEAYAGVYDRDRAELVGEHWEVLYPDHETERFYQEILPELEDRGAWRGVSTGVTKDGDTVPERLVLTQMDDGGHVCIVQELDQYDLIESQLEQKTRALDEAPIGIVLADLDAPDNPVVYANDEFLDITGYDRADVLGRNCRFLQGENTREEPVAKMREAVENRESVTVELRNYRADGTEFWNRVRITPISNDDGEVPLFAGFQEDVTERRAREEQLAASRDRLEALFELSPNILVIHDAEGTIVDVNQQACEELGYEQSDLVGMSVWDVDAMAEPDHALAFWDDLPLDTPQRFEGLLERADGSTFPVEVNLIRVDLDGQDRFIAMDRDISAQKEREEELIRHNERLEEFSNVVSHDLRNPLQVAQGRLGLLEEAVESEHLEDLGNALDRMEALIDDLLSIAQEGEAAMEFEPVDVASVAREAWAAVETGEASLAVDVDLRVDADRDQLQQLFENLFRNAVEHSSTGNRKSTASGDAVEHSSTGSQTESDDAVEHAGSDRTITVGQTPEGFYVADDGPGIPEDDREAVFDPGYSTSEGGTGFGLNIVTSVVDAHDWAVSVTESAEGGARFEISDVHVD